MPLLVADERVAAAAVEALSGNNAVPGTRYAQFALALSSAGLTEDATTHEAKNLISKYTGTVAAAVHFTKVPAAFETLRAACTTRLGTIAAPLEAIYSSEGLGERLGGIGAQWQDLPVRLDDEGLLPTPEDFLGWGPDDDFYEEHIMWAIWLVSMALDQGYVAKLKKALAKFGDRVSVKAAPIKGLPRMRNKLADPDDHALKKRPRPMHNIDTIRAGVVVEDASIIEEVFDTIGKEVGMWLRVKNNYRPAFDSKMSYGYRALLGNLKYESGVTCGALFGENDTAWRYLMESLPAEGDHSGLGCAIEALQKDAMADTPVNIAAEVQLIYEPYLTLGRKKSHLHYKVVRCAAPSDLVRDAAAKFRQRPKMVEAQKVVEELVEGLVQATSEEVSRRPAGTEEKKKN